MTADLGARVSPSTPDSASIRRSQRGGIWMLPIAVVVVLGFGYAPYAVTESHTNTLVNFFILLVLGVMWNVLAGFAGLVSVGQQAYIGLGAYAVLVMAQHGVNPFVALPLAIIICAVVAVPVSLVVFRLRGGYFAIGTWVVAEVFYLVTIKFASLGGGTGASLPGLNYSATVLAALTYWAALAVAVLTLLAAYLLLRSRIGLALTAVRDSELAAASVGVQVSRAKRIVYSLASAGAGGAGGLLIISQLNVQPSDTVGVYGVKWSAYMLFVVLIGGIGSLEGPILGTIVFFVLQQTLANYGAWYLIVIGVVAIAMAMYLRRGLWGLVERSGLRLFPVGYWVRDSADLSGRPAQTHARPS
jgi:branched-chain amino acid transport system permease protein